MKNLPAVRKPMKKRALILLLACVTALALMVPALAHGHHGGNRGQTRVTVCTVEDCDAVGRHVHDGVTYCSYAHENGVCDGKCLALCTVEGCTTAGPHTHNGVTYCGADHECGFCDGTCAVSTATSGRHHHGGHCH